MNEDLLFRKALPADAPRIMRIIRQAQAQMGALGSLQWQDGYPAPVHIEHDIARGYGYVFEKGCGGAEAGGTGSCGGAEARACNDAGALACDTPRKCVPAETIIAYGAVVFDGEPAYEALAGAWLTEGAYVVLHRLAVADEAKRRGVATEFMRRVGALALERGVRGFRVDTNFDNRYMLRMFENLGFVYCGKVCYESGERLAFELVCRPS